MPDYECPNCGGGFPENPDQECPWCGTAIDGSYGCPKTPAAPPQSVSVIDPPNTTINNNDFKTNLPGGE